MAEQSTLSDLLLNLLYSYCTTAPPGPDATFGCVSNNGNLLGQRILFGGFDHTQSYSYDEMSRLGSFAKAAVGVPN